MNKLLAILFLLLVAVALYWGLKIAAAYYWFLVDKWL